MSSRPPFLDSPCSSSGKDSTTCTRRSTKDDERRAVETAVASGDEHWIAHYRDDLRALQRGGGRTRRDLGGGTTRHEPLEKPVVVWASGAGLSGLGFWAAAYLDIVAALLGLLGDAGEKIDLIVSDVLMPQMSGFRFARG